MQIGRHRLEIQNSSVRELVPLAILGVWDIRQDVRFPLSNPLLHVRKLKKCVAVVHWWQIERAYKQWW